MRKIQFNSNNVREEGRQDYLRGVKFQNGSYARFNYANGPLDSWKLGWIDEAIKHLDFSFVGTEQEKQT